MAAKNEMTVLVKPTNQRPSAAQRRAWQIASVSGKQAELKREAAERSARRALNSNAPAAVSTKQAELKRKSATARRSNAR
jgi:hypothetical protein